jgi:hypothetical protein
LHEDGVNVVRTLTLNAIRHAADHGKTLVACLSDRQSKALLQRVLNNNHSGSLERVDNERVLFRVIHGEARDEDIGLDCLGEGVVGRAEGCQLFGGTDVVSDSGGIGTTQNEDAVADEARAARSGSGVTASAFCGPGFALGLEQRETIQEFTESL